MLVHYLLYFLVLITDQKLKTSCISLPWTGFWDAKHALLEKQELEHHFLAGKVSVSKEIQKQITYPLLFEQTPVGWSLHYLSHLWSRYLKGLYARKANTTGVFQLCAFCSDHRSLPGAGMKPRSPSCTSLLPGKHGALEFSYALLFPWCREQTEQTACGWAQPTAGCYRSGEAEPKRNSCLL